MRLTPRDGNAMTDRALAGIVLLVFAQGFYGCGGSVSSIAPLAPTPVPLQAAPPAAPSGWVYGGGYVLTGVTLFGEVFEATPTGRAPIAGAEIYCDACGEFGHTFVKTDANGFYQFSGDLGSGGGVWLSGATTPLNVGKEGYRDPDGLPTPTARLPSGQGWREVRINGDTRFDIELVRFAQQ